MNRLFLAALALALGFEVKPRSTTVEAWLGLHEGAFGLLPGVSPHRGLA